MITIQVPSKVWFKKYKSMNFFFKSGEDMKRFMDTMQFKSPIPEHTSQSITEMEQEFLQVEDKEGRVRLDSEATL